MASFFAKQGQIGGMLRFADRQWVHHIPPEAPAVAYGIGQTADGTIWFGGHGLHSFNGENWSAISSPEELSVPFIDAVHAAPKGDLWIGTRNYGVFHYNGQEWISYGLEDGLADDSIQDILQTADRSVWVATPKGISRFDGRTWSTRALPLNPPGQNWTMLRQSRDGALWINRGSQSWFARAYPGSFAPEGTTGTLRTIRYKPDVEQPPETAITTSLDRVSQPGNTTLAWQGTDLWNRTLDEELHYSWRLDRGRWSPFSTQKSHLFFSLPSGDHTFEVKARDRDFNEDPTPAAIRFTVLPPVWQEPWFIALIILLFSVITLQTGRVVRRDRLLRAEMEKELQTAHDMQMGLMPQTNPSIEGFDIAGYCRPANHVGGDFFQYFHLPQGRLAVAIADVTGHAMEAAIPLVMFSGILENQMESGSPLEDLFRTLNHSLHRILDPRTFVCFAMGELDPSTRTFRLSNGGCPCPYHYRAASGEAMEIQLDAYPLGVRPDTFYQVVEIQLEAGDRVVFYSDGIIEATNRSGEMFGYERTAEIVRQGCEDDLSPEALLERIIETVQAFTGHAPATDDMTCLVLAVGPQG